MGGRREVWLGVRLEDDVNGDGSLVEGRCRSFVGEREDGIL